MKAATKIQIKALAILVALLLVLELAFGGIAVQVNTAFNDARWQQTAQAAGAACKANMIVGATAINVEPFHEICQAGIGQNQNAPCGPIPVPGGEIIGICQSGCCVSVGFTSPADATKSFLGGFFGDISGGGLLKEIGKGLAVSTALGLVGKIFSPGAGGSGSDSGTFQNGGGFSFQTPTNGDSNFLEFDSTLEGEGLSDFSLAFGDDSNTSGEQQQGGGNQTPQQGGSGEQQQGTDGDSVTTAYEYLGSLVRSDAQNPDVRQAEENFDRDFFGSSFSNEEDVALSGRLSLADLEAQGRLLQARNTESQNTNTGLTDFRGSTVARSGTDARGNPLSGDRFGNSGNGEEDNAEKKGFFASIGSFFAKLFGLSSPE